MERQRFVSIEKATYQVVRLTIRAKKKSQPMEEEAAGENENKRQKGELRRRAKRNTHTTLSLSFGYRAIHQLFYNIVTSFVNVFASAPWKMNSKAVYGSTLETAAEETTGLFATNR